MNVRDLSDEELDRRLSQYENKPDPRLAHLSDDDIDRMLAEYEKQGSTSAPNASNQEPMKAAGITSDTPRENYTDSALEALSRHFTQSAINTSLMPGNAADWMASKMLGAKPNPVSFDFAGKTDHEFAAGAGDILGSMVAPGLGVAKLAQKATAIPKMLRSIVGGAGEGAGWGALSSISNTSENSDIQDGATAGAGWGAGLAALLHAPSAATSAAGSYAERYRKKLTKDADKYPYIYNTPEAAEKLSSRLGDIPANIGTIAGNNKAKDFYSDALGSIPFSGISAREDFVRNKAREKAANLLNELKGGAEPEDIPKTLLSHISSVKKEKKAIVKNKYDTTFDIAEQSGVNFDKPENFKNAVSDILESQKNGGAKEIDSKDIKYIKSLRRKLTMQPSTLRAAHNTRSDIGDAAYDSMGSSATTSAAYNRLKDAIDSDMRDAINRSGNKDIINLYQDATKFFKEEYVPYRGKKIDNLMQNKTDQKEMIIANALLDTQNKKIFENLPRELKNLVAYVKLGKGKHLENGETVVSPARTSNIAQSIEPSIRKRLFTDQQQMDFDDLNAAVTAAKKAEVSANKPPTGKVLEGNMIKALIVAGLKAGAFIPLSVANKLEKAMTSKALINAYATRKPVDKEKFAKEVFPLASKELPERYVKIFHKLIQAGSIKAGESD